MTLRGAAQHCGIRCRAALRLFTGRPRGAQNSDRNRCVLQDEIADGPLDLGTLDTLTAYFVLQNAESEYGWTPEKAGLSQDQANEAAAAFSKFDSNDDYRLGAAPARCGVRACACVPRQCAHVSLAEASAATRGGGLHAS